jgi:hypothetical protein
MFLGLTPFFSSITSPFFLNIYRPDSADGRYRDRLRLKFRLDNAQTGVVVSAERDLYLNPNHRDDVEVTFLNIESTVASNLVLIVRMLSSELYGQVLWASEHLRTLVYPLKNVADGTNSQLFVPFYWNAQGSQVEVARMVLLKEGSPAPGDSPQLEISKTVPQLNIQLQVTESRRSADNAQLENEIPTLRYPVSLSTTYAINSYFVRVRSIVHHARVKRTGVSVRCLNRDKRQFVPVFKHTMNPLEYTTAVQKGFLTMEIDEVAEVDLDSGDCDHTCAYLVVEVQRVSRSRGDYRVASFAIIPLSTQKGLIIEYAETASSIPLAKPGIPGKAITHDDYLAVLNGESRSAGFGGELMISTTLQSTVLTS